MNRHFLLAAALAAAPAPAQPQATPALSPGEIAAAAPASEWLAIAPSDLLVMDLVPSAEGDARRVVIQLIPPPFSQPWVRNIRALANAGWWDGLAIVRSQDNYVVQWGDPDAEDAVKAKPLPDLGPTSERDYTVPAPTGLGTDGQSRHVNFSAYTDAFDDVFQGWPVSTGQDETAWPVHCYGSVGVGRDMSPDAGSGAELYAVIGHAPRHLDRNIAVVGRVIEGMEHLSTLTRGTEALGFYKTADERTPIVSIRLGDTVAGLPAYQYLSTESATFARYAAARANRLDPFFIVPAGGADVCNIPVPVRRAP